MHSSPPLIVCRRAGCTNTYRRALSHGTHIEYEAGARVAGWRVGTRGDGTRDYLCPDDARPDPQLVALCRDLAKPSTVEERT